MPSLASLLQAVKSGTLWSLLHGGREAEGWTHVPSITDMTSLRTWRKAPALLGAGGHLRAPACGPSARHPAGVSSARVSDCFTAGYVISPEAEQWGFLKL